VKGSAPSFVERGRTLFNAGSFFEAHELWEDAWREAHGEARVLLQGLIQITAGFHKAGQGKPGACARLLEAGVGKLEHADIVGRLAAFATQVRVALARARAWESGDGEGVGPVPVLPSLGSIESK
jgi:predicted metal-dependent hydrolase